MPKTGSVPASFQDAWFYRTLFPARLCRANFRCRSATTALLPITNVEGALSHSCMGLRDNRDAGTILPIRVEPGNYFMLYPFCRAKFSTCILMVICPRHFHGCQKHFVVCQSLFVVCRKGFVVCQSLFVVRRKGFVGRQKPFVVRGKGFVVCRKPFVGRQNLFVDRQKGFVGCGKPFVVRQKPFNGRKNAFTRLKSVRQEAPLPIAFQNHANSCSEKLAKLMLSRPP